MRADTEARVKAFRRALELAAGKTRALTSLKGKIR